MKKKLIEVALPLDAVNVASAREKSIRHGHPSTLHLWWARRPLAAARAVIFAQMVDDPSGWPDLFPTEEAQEKERQRLFRLIEELVKWENTTNEALLQAARDEIRASWRRTCAENGDHPRAGELFDPGRLPAFHDPFAGGGALPLEAQRLGLEAHASDLNPVAVLINKAMIEIPPKFAGRPPVNPEARPDAPAAEGSLIEREWKGAQGLAEDVRYYGRWMRDEAEKRIGHLYPKIEITAEMAWERPDLERYAGRKLTVIAWLWARTVKSPNPAFRDVDVPLASTFMLSTKKGKEAYVEPVIEGGGYRFTVKAGVPEAGASESGAPAGGVPGPGNGVSLRDTGFPPAQGTTAGKRHAFRCLMSGVPVTYEHIRAEGKAGRMGARLMAIVAEGNRGRVYLSPLLEHEDIAHQAKPVWKPDMPLPENPRDFKTPNYGLSTFADLFTSRQLVALTIFSDLVTEVIARVKQDILGTRASRPLDGKAGGTPAFPRDDLPLRDGGTGATAYAEAVGGYLAFSLDRLAMTGNTLVRWNGVGQKAQHCFGRQALPMIWDYAESNFLATATGSIDAAITCAADPLAATLSTKASGASDQADVTVWRTSSMQVISTDPPYYDNINYADLSDFFYVWLRRSLRPIYPDLFTTVAVPKADELVATPYRHGGKEEAEAFFLDGMSRAMRRLAEQTHPAYPVTIYYAFKQSESARRTNAGGTPVSRKDAPFPGISTGWETFPDCCRNRKIRYYPDQAGSRFRENPSFPRKRESRGFRDRSGFPLSRE